VSITETRPGKKPKSDALRAIPSKVGQARRLIVRTELALSALQAALWIGLVAVSLATVLLLRRRLAQPGPGEDLQPADRLVVEPTDPAP
jgi:hypothetical protein